MEHFSNSTASRIVSNQMKSLRNKTDAFADSISQYSKKSKFSKKFYEQQCISLFGESLLDFSWDGRMLSCITFIPFSESLQGEKIPFQVCISVYLLFTRSHISKHHELAIITNHALQRIMQRSGNLNVIDALKKEINLECVSELAKFYADFENISKDEFKISTNNGTLCLVKDVEVGIFKGVTWYPK